MKKLILSACALGLFLSIEKTSCMEVDCVQKSSSQVLPRVTWDMPPEEKPLVCKSPSLPMRMGSDRIAILYTEARKIIEECQADIKGIQERIDAFADCFSEEPPRLEYMERELPIISVEVEGYRDSLRGKMLGLRPRTDLKTNKMIDAALVEFGITIGAALWNVEMLKRELNELLEY